MELRFIDSAPVTGIRTTADGYKVAEVPVARTGLQDYAGWEVGKPDMPVVRMYRPPEAVFADGYLRTIPHKPVTDDHPKEGVTAANWRKYSAGYTGESIRKDEANGLIYVPMLFADQDVIDKLEAGKREVSCGYTCDVEWTPGTTPDGQAYDAIQRPSALNHIALVSRGRAGSSCRVGDNWQPINDDNKEPSVATKTVKIEGVADGLPFEVTDAAEAVINRLVSARDALKSELADATKEIGDNKAAHDAAIVAKDAEIVKLKAELADAAITPEKLRDAAKSYADTMAKAKALGAAVTDSTSEADAMKAVVDAKMSDKAKGYTADQVALAFNVLAADVKVETTDAFREVIKGGVETKDGAAKARSAYDAMIADLQNGYKGKDA